MKIILFLLFVSLWAFSVGQDALPCGVDNLSCPRTDPGSQPLLCFTAAELCEGSRFCPGGQDEGDNLAALNCDTGHFICSPEQSVTLVQLCDGTADCSNGNDETTLVCEDKCRSPYRGGCAELNRECTASGLDVSCGACLSGYVEVASTCVQGRTVGLQQTLYYVSEVEGSLTVCAEVLEGNILADEAVLVNYFTASGDAEAPDDFIAQTGTFQMTSSATIECISIPVISDGVDESDQECFTVSISEASGAANLTISPQLATVCIIDADATPVRVGVQQTTYSVGEVDGTQAVCIEVISGNTAGREIVINYSTTDGTAVTPSDYIALSGQVTVTDNAQVQCIPISIVQASGSEEDVECFTFGIAARNPVTGLTVDPSEASVCIIELDAIPVTIGIRPSFYSVNESSGSVHICIEVLSGRAAGRTIYTYFRTVNGDAIAPYDYTYRQRSEYIDNSYSSRCHSVAIISDDIHEEEECFIVSVNLRNNPPKGASLNPPLATVCINDDDVVPIRIGLQQIMYTISETDGYQVVCTEVQSEDTAGKTFGILYTTTTGTALAPEDYTAANGTFQLSADTMIQCIPIAITLDNFEEPQNECFTFSIASPSSVPGLTLYPNETMICITDSEVTEEQVPQLIIHMQKSLYSVSEADGSVDVCAEGTTQQFKGSIQVNYSTARGSAEGDDFVSQRGVFSFSNGTMVQCASIAVTNDNVSETYRECFTVSLSGATEYTVYPSVATVCISDDDAHPVRIGLQKTMYSIGEVDGPVAMCVEILAGDANGRNIVLNYSTSSGTATAGNDYTSLHGSITITDDARLQCVIIPIVSDDSREQDVECFTFGISAVDTVSGLTLDPAQASVCITDKDAIPVTIGIGQSFYSVNESSGSVLICFGVLSGRTAGRRIYIYYQTLSGDARYPHDYGHRSSTEYIDDGRLSRCFSVTIVSDSYPEEEECFVVSIHFSNHYYHHTPSGASLNPSQATVCILDDDATPIRIGLQQTMYSVFETDGYQEVCAEALSGDTAGLTIEIHYSTTSGTAIAPGDYVALSGTFQLNDDALLQCIPIAITLDDVDEPEEECFIFSISSPSNVPGLTLYPNETTICITDSEVTEGVPQLAIHMQKSFYSVSENNVSVDVCAEVTTQQFEGSIQVNYSTASGSAEGDDFVSQSGVLFFSNDTIVHCVSITISNDNISETNRECFTVSLSGAVEYTVNPSVATVCINDDDAHPVRIGLQKTMYSIGEVDGTLAVCMEVLSGDTNGRNIVINYSTSGGTALAGDDYTSLHGSITITDDARLQCIVIAIVSDNSREQDVECFTFSISAADTVSGLTLDPAQASVCITDKDAIPVTIGIRQTFYSVNESSGSVDICFGVLSGRLAGRRFYTYYHTKFGDAKSPYDYSHVSSYVYSRSSWCFSVAIVNDSLPEGEECFIASIFFRDAPRGASLNPSQATICIKDNDATPIRIGLQQTMYSVFETDGYQEVCAEVLSGDTAGLTIEIHYSTTSGTALAPEDYIALSGTFQLNDDALLQCIPIAITLDDVDEPEGECFTFRIASPSSVPGLTLYPNETMICITDSEVTEERVPQLAVHMQKSLYSVNENNGSVDVCAEVTTQQFDGIVQVNYSTARGSAKGDDFVSQKGVFSFSNGTMVQCASIAVTNDNVSETYRECFTVSLSGATEYTVYPSVATVCISDDDAHPVRIGLQKTMYSVDEVDGTLAVCVEILSGDANGRNIDINYSTSGGTAIAGNDYTHSHGSITLMDDARLQCIPISIVSDSTNEQDVECFTVGISAKDTVNGLTLDPAQASVCITDKDAIPVTIGIRQSFYSVNESSGSVYICIEVLSGRTAGRRIYTYYRTVDGDAIASYDYTPVQSSVYVENGRSSRCFSVTIISDSIPEEEECFIISVSFNRAPRGASLNPQLATVCINDDDAIPIRIGLQQTMYTVSETDGYQVVCTEVQSEDTAGKTVEIHYTTTSGTALAPEDYTTLVGTFQLSADTMFQCIPIPITLDDVEELQNECFTFSIASSSSVPGLTLHPNEATICIIDSEVVNFRIVAPSNVSEDSGSVMICVEQMNNQLSEDVYVDIRTTQIGSTAAAVSDYSLLATTLTFTLGITGPSSLCDNITINDDNLVEGDEEIIISAAFRNPLLEISFLNNYASITINDNDYVVYKWEYPEYRAVEDSESLMIVQFCLAEESGTLISQVQVAVTSIPISATADVDFSSVSGTLLFDSSRGAGICLPMTLTIIKDDLFETEEMFQLSASVSTSQALSPPGGDVTTIVIQDDDECRSDTSDCAESTGAAVVGGLISGVLLTVVLAVVIFVLVGWKCRLTKKVGGRANSPEQVHGVVALNLSQGIESVEMKNRGNEMSQGGQNVDNDYEVRKEEGQSIGEQGYEVMNQVPPSGNEGSEMVYEILPGEKEEPSQ